MKTRLTLPKITTFLFTIMLISTGISCKDQKSPENVKDQMDELDKADSFGGSSKRDDICNFFDKEDVRLAFDISDDVAIEQKESESVICSYEWTPKPGEMLFYSLSLNFARGGKRSNGEIDAAWKGQNEGVYSKHSLEKVSGLGDKASWSDLGGGQLRVAKNGYIFYVSLMSMPSKNNTLSKQEMIDKTSILAKKVIKKM